MKLERRQYIRVPAPYSRTRYSCLFLGGKSSLAKAAWLWLSSSATLSNLGVCGVLNPRVIPDIYNFINAFISPFN
ncbi:MAG: hypothetical protein LM555_02705 [Desulfurococcaceae archaeon]|nr:hypothetical protein [Desulfurococcaceae archaeon]